MPASEGGALRLRVVAHPHGIFYKDEGGKGSHLTAVLVVESEDGSKGALGGKQGGAVQVVPTLCYENGNEVEDGVEIFRVLSQEPKVVTSTEQKVTVKFRIEKVSRRKDGQRFKVCFSSGRGACVREVAPCFTSSVCVLSKRKSSGHHLFKGGRGSEEGVGGSHHKSPKPATKLRSKSISSTTSTVSAVSSSSFAVGGARALSQAGAFCSDAENHDSVAALRKMVAALKSTVESLLDRVEQLEGEQAELKRWRAESASADDSHGGASVDDDADECCDEDVMHVHKRFKLEPGCDDVDDLSDIVDDDFEPAAAGDAHVPIKPEPAAGVGPEINFAFGLATTAVIDDAAPYY
jgi:hypothetical protein